VRVLRAFAGGLALGISAFAAVCFAQAPTARKNTKEKQETCRVSGMVVRLADGIPLKGAAVRLENAEDHEHTIASKTTDDGRFELRNVPSGRYKLVVSRNGYVETEYGQKKPSDPGAAFTLSPGQTKTDLIFKLIPAAVIAGRVFNEDGEPVPNASVTASREAYQEGRKTMTPFTQVTTDDLGAFRLFGLPPGRYFVSAMERQWGNVVGDKEFSGSSGQTASEQGYAKTYYPGTSEIARASAINVKVGDEVPGTDIPLKQVLVHRIRGRVLNQITQNPGQAMEVLLIARAKKQDWDFGGQTEVKKADGSFEVSNVVPGPYTLIAFWYDQSEGKARFGSQRIDVGESDVEGVSVVVGAGVTIQGRVVWDGNPSLERNELTIHAALVDTAVLPGGRALVEANQFTLKDLIDGDARVQVLGASKDCYVKQITFGQIFVKDDVISVSKGNNPALEITLSSRGAQVQGAVVDKDGLPAPGVWVVAVPDVARRTTERLFKSQTTDQYGKFDLHGLAPGTYKLFAWDGAESNAWEDEDFLKPFEDQGTKIEVRDEDALTANLTVISIKHEGND
jgi:Carboxypeptidase regulatory-like domain